MSHKTQILTYDCDGCAACCHEYSIPVRDFDLIQEPQLQFYAEQFEGDDCLLIHPRNGDCPFLAEHGTCNIYATKPRCCTVFEPGSAMCQYARGKAGLPLLPGEWKMRIPLETV